MADRQRSRHELNLLSLIPAWSQAPKPHRGDEAPRERTSVREPGLANIIDPERRLGIRRRWLINSVGSILALVIVALICFSTVFISYCYSNLRSGLRSEVSYASDFISSYATSESAYLEMAGYYLNSFQYKDKLELQFVNPNGTVQLSSYVIAGTKPNTDDISSAIANHETISWIGKDPYTGERIMAVSSPIVVNGEVKGLIRLVTSLTLVDRQILLFTCLACLLGVGIVALVYFTNLYLIRSIVEPMASITETAKHIAAGTYGIQIEKRYQDEIGDLIDAINDMSTKINQSEKTKSEFISSVSHELRTPLTAINGWSETLLSGEVSDPESMKKGLSIIVNEGKRLSKMVEELLEFSRIEDGRFKLNIEPVDIQAEFEDAIFTYRQFYRKKNINLVYKDTAEELPMIPGDPERLRQVFSNVLDNAAKHGGEDQTIHATLYRDGDMVAIRIRDHGPGVPEKDLPHVKEKFYKGSSKARGNGIGLAVCDEIITRLGGDLTIANAEGGGCAVTFTLPMTSPNTDTIHSV